MSLRIPKDGYKFITMQMNVVITLTGETYRFDLINTEGTTQILMTDISEYPNIYLRFLYVSDVELESGWYKYILYNSNDIEIKSDKCYIYNSDEPGNIPQDTNTYEEDKDKYVYNR